MHVHLKDVGPGLDVVPRVTDVGWGTGNPMPKLGVEDHRTLLRNVTPDFPNVIRKPGVQVISGVSICRVANESGRTPRCFARREELRRSWAGRVFSRLKYHIRLPLETASTALRRTKYVLLNPPRRCEGFKELKPALLYTDSLILLQQSPALPIDHHHRAGLALDNEKLLPFPGEVRAPFSTLDDINSGPWDALLGAHKNCSQS